ncbi:MAG: glycosyltransferase, partial [Actinomycetota bacterium]
WSAPTGPSPDRSFFPIPGNTTVGAIRFNLAGRESQGVVAPGELDALRRRLSEELLRVVDVDSGRPLVRAVVASEEVVERSAGDGLPDLFVEWDRSSLVERAWSPSIGTVAAPYQHWRTGDHNDRGMVVVRAPGVRPGRRREPMSLADLAPTLCASLGVELSGADGAVRADLLPAGVPAPRGAAPDRRPLRALAPDQGRPRGRRPAPAGETALDLGLDTARSVAALERRVGELGHLLAIEEARGHQRDQRLAALERERRVWATMLWLEQEPVVQRDLVSVILPTHRRPDKLRRAIDSVLAQRYPHWELVIVDDGDEAGKSVVADVGDDRIVYRQISHSGACAARNAALDVAQGSIVTYLDDDNTLHPGWLHAVAWAFEHHPEHDVLYGARLFDDEERSLERGEGGFPWIQLEPYDRAGLEQHNMADMGVIAHRAGIPGARFDEAFWECGDWDFFLAITEDRAPLMLPVVAFCYRTDGHDRLTGRFVDHAELVRQKWARRRAEGQDRQDPTAGSPGGDG